MWVEAKIELQREGVRALTLVPLPGSAFDCINVNLYYVQQGFSLAVACLDPFGGDLCWRLSAPPAK